MLLEQPVLGSTLTAAVKLWAAVGFRLVFVFDHMGAVMGKREGTPPVPSS